MLSDTTKEAAKFTKDSAIQDVTSAANNAQHKTSEAACSMTENISGYAHEAGKKMRDTFASANDHIEVACTKVKSEIETNPVRSSLVALGAGVVLGMLLRRN